MDNKPTFLSPDSASMPSETKGSQNGKQGSNKSVISTSALSEAEFKGKNLGTPSSVGSNYGRTRRSVSQLLMSGSSQQNGPSTQFEVPQVNLSGIDKAKYSPDQSEFGIDAVPLSKIGSNMRASMGTTGSGGGHSGAREISETFTTKFFEMRWCLAAMAVNCLLVYFITSLKNGLSAPVSTQLITSVGSVVLELILLLANIITLHALDDGASAYFGYHLASRRGYSLAVCGFLHGNMFDKMSFSSQLSLNSTCRKLLSRASLIWLSMNAILLLTPLTATALKGEASRQDSGTVSCLIFDQIGVPADRHWPNAAVESGIGELVFGSALGTMRSEVQADFTTSVISPQIIGAVNDGDTIVGPGFTMDIYSSCSCAQTSDLTGIVNTGVDSTTATSLVSQISSLGTGQGIANVFVSKSSSVFYGISALTGTIVCGGANTTNPTVPICNTTFTNHNRADILVSYMTDGTTASIAPRYVDIRNISGTADLSTWAYTAMKNIFGGVNSAIPLPPTVPDMVNPLIYWMTSNLLAIDSTLLEPGLETLYAIMFRAGVQRTYSTQGMPCARNIQVPNYSILSLQYYGYATAIVILSVQLFATAIAISGFFPWFQSTAPIGPAVRITKDAVYFTMMVNGCSIIHAAESLCNAPPHVIWEAMDVVVRVGESLSTREDPQLGHITLDKPKVVCAFTNGKRYL